MNTSKYFEDVRHRWVSTPAFARIALRWISLNGRIIFSGGRNSRGAAQNKPKSQSLKFSNLKRQRPRTRTVIIKQLCIVYTYMHTRICVCVCVRERVCVWADC